jgi:hypothetical protein
VTKAQYQRDILAASGHAPFWPSQAHVEGLRDKATKPSGLSDYFFRLRITPESNECSVPQPFIWRPLGKFDFGDYGQF